MIFLDASILIAYESLTMPPGAWALSVLTYCELALGAAIDQDESVRAVRKERLRRWDLVGLDWLPFDRVAAQGYAEVAAEVWRTRRSHARSRDIMLAGQAFALGASVATLNPQDFELVQHLVPIIVPEARV